MTPEEQKENYRKYRGKCREMSEALVAEDPTLRLVRGHYFCPLWCSEEPHWWCVKPDGTIVDPTKLQFPSAGLGIYTEFDGTLECAECGKQMHERDIGKGEVHVEGRYAYCSHRCHGRFVGVFD